MELMELVVIVVVSADAQGDDLDKPSEEPVQYHLELERNVIEPHQDIAHKKVRLFPKFCS
jgi:hypothetical protein